MVELRFASVRDLGRDLHHPVRSALSEDGCEHILVGGYVAFEGASLRPLGHHQRHEQPDEQRAKADVLRHLGHDCR